MTGQSLNTVLSPTRPMICETEVRELVQRYGAPLRRTFNVQADEYIRAYRWRHNSDRRAEVVFAIQDPTGKIWMHSKAHYPAHLCRLPSGGVCLDESIYDALLREVDEETALRVRVHRFVGLIEYRFHHSGSVVKFASYIFHLCSQEQPKLPESGEIYAFRAILPSQLQQLTVDMRNMMGDRRGWGQWRALAHDLVYDYFCGSPER
ncbi:MAG: NUDIX hydrolase [Caldilineaceae bacterium]